MYTLLNRFILAKDAAGCRPNTLRWYRMCITHYLDWTDDAKREYKKPDSVEAYLAYLRSCKRASSTVSGYFTALATWFKWSDQRGYLDDNPMRHIQKPKQIKPVKRRIAKDNFLALYRSIAVNAWHDQRDKCILLTLYYSGLRLTETLELMPTDIDLSEQLIMVRHGKGDKARPVPCHPLLCVELPRYLEMRPALGSEYLFVANDGHGRVRGQLTVPGLRSVLQRRFREAGLPYASPHAFRHSFAVEFLNSGMELSAVGAALGHSSVKTTESEYAYWLTAGLKREYAQALQRIGAPT